MRVGFEVNMADDSDTKDRIIRALARKRMAEHGGDEIEIELASERIDELLDVFANSPQEIAPR